MLMSFSLFAGAKVPSLEVEREPSEKLSAQKRWNFGLSLEALFLRASESSPPFAAAFDSPQMSHAATANRKAFQIDYGWDLGFRFEASAEDLQTGWNFASRLTHLNSDAYSLLERDEPLINPLLLNGPAQVIIQTADSRDFAKRADLRWAQQLNLVDFEWSHLYGITRNLQLQPHFGLAALFLNQQAQVLYDPVFFTTELLYPTFQPFGSRELKIERDLWSVGPRFGFATFWQLGARFDLFAKLAAALLYSQEKRSENMHAVIPDIPAPNKFVATVIDHQSRASRITLSPFSEIELGATYNHLFRGGCEAAFTLGFLSHYFWSQGAILEGDSMQIQGLTAGVKVRF